MNSAAPPSPPSLPAPAAAFAGWVPFHIARTTPDLSILWTWLGSERFRDPFFDQTLSSAFRQPLHLLLQRSTTLEQLVEIAEHSPAIAPTGFIYHVSRCGSTLVAQQLARLDRAIVLSEARPLTAALEDPRLCDADRVRAFRALIRLYGRRSGAESAYIIKLDARSLLDWSIITAAFPEVPRLILHRAPVEVLVSNLGSQQSALMPGQIDPARLGVPHRRLDGPDDFAAFVLSRYYAAAVEAARAPGSLTLDYRALSRTPTGLIAEHFGLQLCSADLSAMQAAAGIYSKDASKRAPFAPDSAAKQAEAGAATRQLAAEWLEPHYRQLAELGPGAG